MKLIPLVILSLFLTSAVLPASPTEAKITKNEAEHIALKQFPTAHVTYSKLETDSGRPVWSLEIAQENGKNLHIAVDATTGHIISHDSKKP